MVTLRDGQGLGTPVCVQIPEAVGAACKAPFPAGCALRRTQVQMSAVRPGVRG